MSGNVTDVTGSSFAAQVLDAEGPVLVHFWAAWAGQCQMMASELEEVAPDYAGGLAFTALDIDHNPETAPNYDVKAIPTLLIFKDGAVAATGSPR